MEDVFRDVFHATMVRATAEWVPAWLPGRFRSWNYSLSPADREVALSGAHDLLFIVSIDPSDLDLLSAIPDWRRRFRTVCAYVFDSFEKSTSRNTSKIDHLFVPVPASAELLSRRYRLPTTVVPMACDVHKFGCGGVDRSIELVGYGRQYRPHSDAFEAAFNAPQDSRMYYHTTLRGPAVTTHEHQRRLFWKILHRSRAALAYDVGCTGGTRFPYPLVGQRWFESLAAGCAVLGKAPRCPETAEYFPWEDATLELPDDPTEAVRAVEALLRDTERLDRIHRRNHAEMLARHDWRHRITDVLATLGLSSPAPAPPTPSRPAV